MNKQKFKHGDKIKYTRRSNTLLTKDKVYIFDKYNEQFDFIMIKGVYDDGSSVGNGVGQCSFVLAKPVKPKDDRKKYTLIHSERVGYDIYSAYIPRIKKIKVKDIVKYLDKTDLYVQYVIKGHVTLV